MAGTVLLGKPELDRKLNHLSGKASKRAIVAGIKASLIPIARAMRTGVNASSASHELKKAARQSIGSRFTRKRWESVREAKVGFAVGKSKKSVAKRSAKRGEGRPGAGVSASNIHWFVLGTDERTTKSGKSTGRIEGVFAGVTDAAVGAAGQASLAAASKKIQQVIHREARKRV